MKLYSLIDQRNHRGTNTKMHNNQLRNQNCLCLYKLAILSADLNKLHNKPANMHNTLICYVGIFAALCKKCKKCTVQVLATSTPQGAFEMSKIYLCSEPACPSLLSVSSPVPIDMSRPLPSPSSSTSICLWSSPH